MNYGKALYFPYIIFQDENWLKYSLLYWDGIKRILPVGYKPDDSPVVRTLIDIGLIENVDPTTGVPPYTVEAAEEFIPTLKEILKHRGSVPLRGVRIAREISKSAKNSLIHIQKMDDRVIRLLEDANLASRFGDWFAMDGVLAGYYMLCLAGHISEKQNTPLLCDSFEMETAGMFFQHSRIPKNFSPAYDVELRILKAILPIPCPERLNDIPIEKIVKFHTQYEAERMQFRRALSELIEGIASVSDPSAINDFIQENVKVIRDALKDQRQAMSAYKVGVIDSLMSMGVPSSITGLSTSFNPVSMTIAAGIGLAFSLIKWFVKAKTERQKTIRDCDWNYLLSLEKKFNTKQIAAQGNTRMDEFIND